MTVQQNNMMLLDASGLPRTVDTANDSIRLDVPVSIQAALEVGADVNIAGDLTVQGDIVSRSQTDVLIQDSYLDLNFGDDSATVSGGGFTVSMAKASGFTTETVTAFTAGVGGVSAPSFTVSGSSNLAAGDVVAIAGAGDSENDGLFIVAGVAGGVVTIKGIGGSTPSANLPFVQNQFATATSQTAKAYKVDLAAVAIADGSNMTNSSAAAWPVGSLVSGYMAAATESGWYWDAPTNVSLQEAYEVGNTITTSAAEGDVTIAGDQKLIVSATGGLQVSGGVLDLDTSVDMDLTGSFAVDGAQTVAFGAGTAVTSFGVTTGTGDIALTAAGKLDVSATGAIEMDAGAASYIKATAADLTVETTSTGILDLKSAAEVQVSTVLFDVNASGAVEIASVGNSFVQTTSGDLLLQTLTSGELDLTSAGLMDVNAGANLDLDVTGTMSLDSTGAFSVDGTGASNVTAQGDLSVQAQGSGADLILEAADVIDMNGGSLDADLTGAFNVTGGASSKLNTTAAGAGDITIDAEAGKVIIDGGKAAVSDAVKIWASAATGGIQMVAGTGNIDAATTGSMYLGASQASSFTVSGGDLLLDATSDVDGAIKVYAAGPLADAVHIHASDAAGGIDIDAGSSGIALDTTGPLSLDSTGTASNLTLTANDAGTATLTIAASNSGAGAADVDIDADGAVMVDAVGAVSLEAGAASDFTVNAGALTLEANNETTGAVQILGGGALAAAVALQAFDAAGGIDIDSGTGGIDALTTGAISLDAGAASNLTVTGSGESLTLAAAGGGAQQLVASSAGTGTDALRFHASAGGIDIDAADLIAIDSAKGVSFQGALSSDLKMVANSSDDQILTIDAQNSGAGQGILVLHADDSIAIGDTNKADLQIDLNGFTAFNVSAGLSVKAGETLAVGDAVYVKYDTDGPRYFKAANNAVSDDARVVMGISASSASAGDMFPLQCVVGVQALTAVPSLANDKIGKPVYLGTGGALTLTAPTASGTTVFRVGYVSDNDAGGAMVHFAPQFIAKRP